MDAPEEPGGRGRRAFPLIAGAVAAMMVAGLIFLNPTFPSLRPVAPPPPGPSLVQAQFSSMYSFVSATIGWALVVGPEGQPSPSYVYRTTDGAKHWNLQLTSYPAYNPAVAGIKFFDSKHGLVSIGTGAVYRTSDGGTVWDQVRVPLYPLNEVTFSDPSHGWMLASEPDRGPRHFFTSADRGDTWTELALPLAGTGVGGLRFRTQGEGWRGGGVSEPNVYSTTNGGASWQPHTLPRSAQARPDTPSGADSVFNTTVSLLPGVGVIAIIRYAAGFAYQPRETSFAYTSIDGGTTWRPIAPPPGSTNFSDFVFQDSSHWWAMQFGDLWKSSDAGQSWKIVSHQLDGWVYRPQVIDAKLAWAELLAYPGIRDPGQGTGLATSSDGGLHWTQVDAPRPT